MGFDYALVHLKYTVPPAILLTFIYRPLFTRLDIYKIFFLITIAVASTIPWDSYLIRTNVWSYPSSAVIGPKLFDIPAEEIFFFVIQTYNTSLLYLLLNKATFHPIYLRHEEKGDKGRYYKLFGQVALALVFKRAIGYLKEGKEGTYLGLILVWALPFVCLLWNLAYQFILGLPLTGTLLPIALPTVYLWLVDTLALRRGTWVIESGTKLGINLWPGLEIEEAVFFFLTNTMIVFGLIAFDNALAVLNAFPVHFPLPPALPSPVVLVRALLLPAGAYDNVRLEGLRQAAERLRRKSRSFYLASGVFQGRLRSDLIILYSFCRVADDLIDNAQSPEAARQWIKKLTVFLNLCYKSNDPMARDPNVGSISHYVAQNFPRNAYSSLIQLQTNLLTAQPLYDLLKGFDMDLEYPFNSLNNESTNRISANFPIKTEADLDTYGLRVAGTVAELCLELVFYHHGGSLIEKEKKALKSAGSTMGIALQYTNIARDIQVDATIGRLYIPTAWLKKEKLTPLETLQKLQDTKTANSSEDHNGQFFAERIERLRARLLERAFALYEEARPTIERLPVEARGPMRVAVESYMEIGRVLKGKKGWRVKKGRATVPWWRRIIVAWRALSR